MKGKLCQEHAHTPQEQLNSSLNEYKSNVCKLSVFPCPRKNVLSHCNSKRPFVIHVNVLCSFLRWFCYYGTIHVAKMQQKILSALMINSAPIDWNKRNTCIDLNKILRLSVTCTNKLLRFSIRYAKQNIRLSISYTKKKIYNDNR